VKTAILKEKNKIVISERKPPELRYNEVLVNIKKCSISGTDLRIYQGKIKTKLPIVLGQEFSGIIKSYGEKIRRFFENERVVIEPIIYCGRCNYCRKGFYTLCNDLKVLGVNSDGGLTEYISVPEYTVHGIPNNLSLEEAALTVPVATALYAIRNANIGVGDNIIIFGAGAIGLSALQLARISGADKVIVIEPAENKKRLAERFGAYDVLSPGDITKSDISNEIKDINIVIETSGSIEALYNAFEIVNKKGMIIIVGVYGVKTSLNMDLTVKKNLTVIGSWLYPHLFEEALKLITTKRVSVREYISGKYSLSNIKDAFEEALNPNNIRIIVNI